MQSTRSRWLILIAVMLFGSLLLSAIETSRVVHEARWPTESSVFAVESWHTRPPTVQYMNGAQYVSRTYHRPDAAASTATLTLVTSPNAKDIYRAGADVPLLANGYAVEPAPTSLVPEAPGRAAVIFRNGSETGLVVYAFGERRGLLGNGALGWGLVAVDAGLGRRNDYFRVFVLGMVRESESATAREIVALVDTLFPRLVSWYGT